MTSIVEHIGLTPGLSPWQVLVGTLNVAANRQMSLSERNHKTNRTRNLQRGEATRQRVLDLFKAGGEYSYRTAIQKLDIREVKTVSKHVHALYDAGLLKYRVGRAGEKFWRYAEPQHD